MLKAPRLALAALVLVMFAGGWLFGRGGGPDPAPVGAALPPHYQELGLSEKQAETVRKIVVAYNGKIELLQQELDKLKAAEAKDTESVLTDDQKAALYKAVAESAKPPKDK